MKTLIMIMLAAIIGIHSSGREPGAAASGQHNASSTDPLGCPWLPPGATGAATALYIPEGKKQPIGLHDHAFAAVTVTVDPKGQPLGAYQFELTSPDAAFTVVGVEGGDHPAFDHGRPPYFDPVTRDKQGDRLIVAEFALPELEADALPAEAVRVATVHVMFAEPVEGNPELAFKLTAGNADGNPIDAELTYEIKLPERAE